MDWFVQKKIQLSAVVCGKDHSGAVSKGGDLYTWGRGEYGQLGNGTDKGSTTPCRVPHFRVVHPSRTLRRKERAAPRTRRRELPRSSSVPARIVVPAVRCCTSCTSACLP